MPKKTASDGLIGRLLSSLFSNKNTLSKRSVWLANLCERVKKAAASLSTLRRGCAAVAVAAMLVGGANAQAADRTINYQESMGTTYNSPNYSWSGTWSSPSNRFDTQVIDYINTAGSSTPYPGNVYLTNTFPTASGNGSGSSDVQ
jgi:hypothetical protein